MKPQLTTQILNLYINHAWCIVDGQSEYSGGDWRISHRIAEQFARGQIKVMPVLRPLNTITQQEAKEYYHLEADTPFEESIHYFANAFAYCGYATEQEWALAGFLPPLFTHPSQTLYLCSKAFDIFGLIEAGFAKEANPDDYLIKTITAIT